MTLSEKEKRWLKEGIAWITQDIRFTKRKGKLCMERKQYVEIHGSPTEFIKKIGLVEDGITQEDLNRAFKEIEKEIEDDEK